MKTYYFDLTIEKIEENYLSWHKKYKNQKVVTFSRNHTGKECLDYFKQNNIRVKICFDRYASSSISCIRCIEFKSNKDKLLCKLLFGHLYIKK